MPLQFQLEEPARPLASLFFQSSDEDIEIDYIYSVQDETNCDSDDDDIQVIGRYSEASEFPPQLVAGRAMTTELADCMSNLGLPETEQSECYFTEPSEELKEWFVGNPSPTYSGQHPYTHPITQCGRIDPLPYSPMSSPLIDQHPNYALQNDNNSEPLADHWANTPHITGLGVSVSGVCGQHNEVVHSGCVVCGKYFPVIKEEVTLGYLKSTHILDETYDRRQARRRAFQAGMKARSFILVPRGVSQVKRLETRSTDSTLQSS